MLLIVYEFLTSFGVLIRRQIGNKYPSSHRSVFQFQEGLSESVLVGTLMTDQFNSISLSRKVSGIGSSMDTSPALYFLTF